ncbi:MAG: ABC transporter substrate-binding protein [Roseburia sp.]|nr:ABC transporter substrate-binding protein [Blautia sp.]MDY5881962.1 ABC transporter substrate-binding protein [Roseburia sp.]
MVFRKKIGAGILAMTMLMSCLAGCSSNSTDKVQTVGEEKKEQVTLTFFGNKADESNVHVIESIMSSFMKDHPNIVITYESIKGTDYYDTLNKRMENGTGDDIFMVNHDTMLELHAKGQVAELTGLSTIDSYTEDQKNQFVSEDGIFWLPTTVSSFGLYCNMDMLKEHNQSVPTNIVEFETVCDYFLEKGITPIVANNDISLKTMAIGVSYFDEYQNGTEGQLFTDLNSGKVGLGESLDAGLTVVEEIIQKGYVDAAVAAETQKTSGDLEAFAKGENPFMLTGAWASNRVKNDFGATFAYEVHPLPVLDDGGLIVINPDVRLSVNSDSEHIEEAKLFVEYFTQAENLQAFCDDQCSISPLKNGKESSIKEIHPVVECFKAGRVVIGTDARLNLPIWDVTKDASQSLLNGSDKVTVIGEIDNSIQEYIAEN